MRVAIAIWVGDFKFGMVFEPITLIDCVVFGVCGMASIKFNKETAILQCRWVMFYRALQVNADQGPLGHVRARNMMGNKE